MSSTIHVRSGEGRHHRMIDGDHIAKVAVRDAVRGGRPLVDVLAAGVRDGDRDQLSLWED